MSKKIYVNHQKQRISYYTPNRTHQTILFLNNDEIEKMVKVAGYVYVKKEHLQNVSEYNFEDVTGETPYMPLKTAEKNFFVPIDSFTQKEIDYILDGFISDFSNWENENGTMKKDEFEIEEEIANSIIKKMEKEKEEKNSHDALVYEYHDGSNWQTVILKADYFDSEWEDFTENFKNIKQIDFEKQNTGNQTLYELPNYTQNAIVYVSYYQGVLNVVEFIPKKYKTINEWLTDQKIEY